MNLSEFQQRISESGKPVVVDFWASWCLPCKMTKPILESLADEYSGEVEFLAMNADDSREVLRRFQVIGIPTVLTLRDGRVVGRVTGAQNEANYRRLFAALVLGQSVKLPLAPFDRVLRLGAGGLLVLVGIVTGGWFLMGLGGIVAFLGIYDRCPIWTTITGMRKRKEG